MNEFYESKIFLRVQIAYCRLCLHFSVSIVFVISIILYGASGIFKWLFGFWGIGNSFKVSLHEQWKYKEFIILSDMKKLKFFMLLPVP